jgi:hypothetical protein
MRAQRLPWSRSDCRRVYLLGSLADHLGLRAAFTIEPVLIGACALLLLAGLRALRRPIPIRTVDNRPIKTS